MRGLLFLLVFLISLGFYSCVSLKRYNSLKREANTKDSLIYNLKEDSSNLFSSLKNLDNKYFELVEENKRIKLVIDQFANSSESYAGILHMVPVIPVPPPQPTSYFIFPDKILKSLKKYSQIDSLISKAFEVNMYNKIYLAVENGGFAIATDFEEINKEGEVIDKEKKSNSSPSFADIVSKKVNDIFFSKVGFYRCIIVVVSPNLYQLGGNKISYDELVSWLNVKTIKLPDDIAKSSSTKPLQMVALLYEFQQNENTNNTIQILDDAKSKTKLASHALIKTLLNEN